MRVSVDSTAAILSVCLIAATAISIIIENDNGIVECARCRPGGGSPDNPQPAQLGARAMMNRLSRPSEHPENLGPSWLRGCKVPVLVVSAR